jgi:hypothetical protein
MSSPLETVQRLIEGFRATALLSVAVRLKIFDALDSGPKSPRELAAALQLNEGALHRILRGLVLLGVMEELSGDESRYGLNGAGQLLRTDAGTPLASYARLSQEQYFPAWSRLEEALRSGKNPFEAAFRQPVWDYRRENPEAGALFSTWLHAQSAGPVERIAAALPCLDGGRIADVGGGRGVLLAKVLQRFPACRGVLADQATVLETAAPFWQENGLRTRCEFVPTDFFAAVPPGCKIYFLKSVLHDWADDDAAKILRTLHEMMPHDARLYIIERLLPSRSADEPDTVWIDLAMLAVTGGRERTRAEYASLLDHAGLRLVRVIETDTPFRVLEAIRA